MSSLRRSEDKGEKGASKRGAAGIRLHPDGVMLRTTNHPMAEVTGCGLTFCTCQSVIHPGVTGNWQNFLGKVAPIRQRKLLEKVGHTAAQRMGALGERESVGDSAAAVLPNMQEPESQRPQSRPPQVNSGNSGCHSESSGTHTPLWPGHKANQNGTKSPCDLLSPQG